MTTLVVLGVLRPQAAKAHFSDLTPPSAKSGKCRDTKLTGIAGQRFPGRVWMCLVEALVMNLCAH